MDVVVVGAGIIGATISNRLRNAGAEVLLLDDKRPLAGTLPSGGHIRPSWLRGMSSRNYDLAMQCLNETWNVLEETFVVSPLGKSARVYRVDTDVVVKTSKVTKGRVTRVVSSSPKPFVKWTDSAGRSRTVRCDLVIVCAGVWCGELLKGLDIKEKQGISFRFSGRLECPFIIPWAPYRQIVAHQQGPSEIWIGDGTAILRKNWTEERASKCLERCRNQLICRDLLRSISGLRPYCNTEGNPCLLKEVSPNIWVATGAGKLGTIAAGWAADQIMRRAL